TCWRRSAATSRISILPVLRDRRVGGLGAHAGDPWGQAGRLVRPSIGLLPSFSVAPPAIRRARALALSSTLSLAPALACTGEPPAEESWQIVHQDLPGALLSVWGTSS